MQCCKAGLDQSGTGAAQTPRTHIHTRRWMRIAVACDLAAIFRALGGFPAAAAAAVRSLFQSLQLLPACASGELEDEMNAGRVHPGGPGAAPNKQTKAKQASLGSGVNF